VDEEALSATLLLNFSVFVLVNCFVHGQKKEGKVFINFKVAYFILWVVGVISHMFVVQYLMVDRGLIERYGA
jgi:hypothetical protein